MNKQTQNNDNEQTQTYHPIVLVSTRSENQPTRLNFFLYRTKSTESPLHIEKLLSLRGRHKQTPRTTT